MNKTLLFNPTRFLYLLFCFFVFTISFGQSPIVQSIPGTYTFTVPCDVTSITVEAWGGGGAGGGSRTNNRSGEGGGAGGYTRNVLSVTSGQIISYVVGAGGAGSTNNGGNGGNSTFLGLTASGGNGGDRDGDTTRGFGGNASGGTVNTPGGNGGNGGSGVGGTGGSAGGSGGTGGLGASNNDGNDGNSPGGGGGGAEYNGSNRAGGNGGNGQVRITYTSSLTVYCTPNYNNNVEPITNVTFAGINNTTTNVLGGPSLEVFCSPLGSVLQGSSANTISVQGNTDGNFTEFIKVFIDWDQNGVFGNNANEIFDLGTIVNSTGIDGKFASGNIAVPSTAFTGTTKMRVVKTYFAANSNNPCFSGADWGQAEDYNVLVRPPVPVVSSFTPNNACIGSGATVVITGANFTGATSVQFNGVNAASFAVNSNTQITAILPANATSGAITITTPSGTGFSTTNFTATPPPGDQTSYGASSWIGYVYASTNGGNPPSNAFTTNYVGNITQAEMFDLNLGNGSVSGPNLCNTYADNFAIRFKMNKNMPAGNYSFNVGADDGYRLSIDGGTTYLSGINNWTNHGYVSSNQTVFLNGNTDFVLEYFETTGSSRVSFSYTYCPVNAGTLSGNQYLCTYNPNQTTTFLSTISGGTWTSSATGIATVNASSGLVTGIAAGTATITYTITGNSPGCSPQSTSRDVYVASGPGMAAVISGSNNLCQGTTANYTITPVAGSFSYAWSYSGTGATITPAADGLSASITYSSIATSGNILVRSTNACGSNNGGNERFVTVGALPTAASIAGTTSVCIGAAQPNIVFTNPQNYGVRINYNINGGATTNIYVNANTTSSIGVSTATAGTFTYNLVSVENGVGSPSCFSAVSGSATVTVNALLSNNSLSFINGTSGQSSATAAENANAVLTAPAGTYFAAVNFSSYGTPTGTSPNFLIGSCNSATSQSVAETRLLGNGTTSIPATNGVFGDPCNGTVKRLYVLASYAEALCSGSTATITGSAPAGGTGTYTYAWESSTTSATTGFTAAAGTNNLINYTSGALTQTTYFRRTVTSCSYTSVSSVVLVKVNPIITSNTVLGTQSICSGSIPSTLTGSTPLGGNGSYVYLWESSTTSATAGFTTATGTNNTINYSPGPLTTSTWYRRITTSGACVSTTTAIAVTVATAATPTIGTITQPTCAAPTGTVVLSGLPSSGTWTVSRSGSSSASFTGTGTSTTISGLAAGSYTFTVTLASCTSAATANVPINALVTTSYNGSSWSVAPTVNTRGVITNSGTIATNVDLCSCTVNTGVTATIADGVMMRLQNELVVTGTGSITFNKNSSLVQINATAANSGSIFYERETTPITNFDYTYWSSPVAGQKLIDFSPNTLGDKFLSFNSFSNSWNYEDAYNNLMGKGVGYIIRGPQTKSGQPPSTQLYRFTGAPNNGPVSLPIGAAGNSVLIGNPYPSALDADKFLDANASLIEGTIYFWTHNTSLRLASSLAAGTAGSGSYAYTSDDYAAYNRTGGVATYAAPSASNPSPSSPIVSGNAPTSNIGAGQSFFGTSLAAGSVQFINNMRVGFTGLTSNSNSQFFKTTSVKKTVETVEKNRIWIDLTNEEGAFKETLLGYITGASNAYETAFDGESYDANAFVDFYSINEDKKLTIQGRALPFDDSEIIPLGYKANIGGQFSITIRDKDGLFTTQNVYLEDKLLGTVFDLNQGTYRFTTETGVFNDRFAIRYTSKTLGVEVFDPVAEGVYISTKNKVITVQVGTETIVAAYVYDLAGKQLFAKKSVDLNQMAISNLNVANVVLIVKVVLNNGSVVTQKIVY